MARPSKRDFIVNQATELFLVRGFKGTSIDMVVAACKVSKPTVYNHFPDKKELILAVIEYWTEQHQIRLIDSSSPEELLKYLVEHWWFDEAIAMYRLVIGEGLRFPDAANIFWRFDKEWQKAVSHWLENAQEDLLEKWQWRISHELWSRIRDSAMPG